LAWGNAVQVGTPMASHYCELADEMRTAHLRADSRSKSLVAQWAETMKKRQSKVRVLLADDHPVVRKGICSCLARHNDLEIVGEAADGQEAVCKAKELSPDVVLMDLCMPQMDGLEATKRLHKEAPNVKVLILSVNGKGESIQQIIQAGAKGYVLKDAPPEELVQAIQSASKGEAFFSRDVAKLVLNQYVSDGVSVATKQASRLTSRELEVLARVAEGQSNKEIASRLNVSVRTVESHRERIMLKLDIHSVVGLTRFAIANGIVALN
jgi:two-component system nitrate/nitrite response regulator NarL